MAICREVTAKLSVRVKKTRNDCAWQLITVCFQIMYGIHMVTIGANPQRVSTEIIIEIKQFNAGRMASHPFIEGIPVLLLPSKMDF